MAPLFNHILVPVDGTARGDEGLRAAGQLAGRFGARVLVLHVEGRATAGEEVSHDDERLAVGVRALCEQGVDARYTVAYDPPADAIEQVAADEKTDLIVMAPHHWNRLELLRHSSVTAKLMVHAPVPVLVWPEAQMCTNCSSLLRIASSVVLVPVDGSFVSEQAIPYAIAFAQDFHRPIVLVRVVPPPPWEGGEVMGYDVELWRRAEEIRAAQRYLAALRRRIAGQAPKVAVQSMLLNGDPAHELVRLAQTHDGSLIIMSTHGRVGVDRLLLGSVATAVMRDTPLPLLVVPPEAQRATVALAAAKEAHDAWAF